MRNQNGSSVIVLLLVPLSLAIFMYGGSFIDWFSGHTRLQAQDRVTEDSENLRTSLKMLLSNSFICNQNLVPSGFGTSVAEISTNRSLRIYFPQDSSGPSGVGNTLGAKLSYQNMRFIDLKFDPASLIASSQEKSYIVDLLVIYQNAYSKNEKTLRMPFYFVANSSQQLTDCMATSYASLGITIEDALCQQLKGSDYNYLPGQRACVPKAASMAQN